MRGPQIPDFGAWFWHDPHIRELNREAKLILAYLLTWSPVNAAGTLLYASGIMPVSFRDIEYYTGIPEHRVKHHVIQRGIRGLSYHEKTKTAYAHDRIRLAGAINEELISNYIIPDFERTREAVLLWFEFKERNDDLLAASAELAALITDLHLDYDEYGEPIVRPIMSLHDELERMPSLKVARRQTILQNEIDQLLARYDRLDKIERTQVANVLNQVRHNLKGQPLEELTQIRILESVAQHDPQTVAAASLQFLELGGTLNGWGFPKLKGLLQSIEAEQK